MASGMPSSGRPSPEASRASGQVRLLHGQLGRLDDEAIQRRGCRDRLALRRGELDGGKAPGLEAVARLGKGQGCEVGQSRALLSRALVGAGPARNIPHSMTFGTVKKESSAAGALAVTTAAMPPVRDDVVARPHAHGGSRRVIGSIPSTSTSDSVSTNDRMAFRLILEPGDLLVRHLDAGEMSDAGAPWLDRPTCGGSDGRGGSPITSGL